MRKLSIALLLTLGAAATSAQELATEIRTLEVAPGIYMLDGANGFSSTMSLLVGDEHIVLVDDGMAPITADLMTTVERLGGRGIDFIVNTHVHGDHVGSNATLAESGALIFAHDNLRKRLVESPDDAGGPAGLPVVTFADSVTFHVNGTEAHVFHIEAAHTDGDAVMHFRDADVIHAGDLFFNYMFPFIDLDNGGTVAGFIAGQRRLHDMADEETRIIPGHGALADRDDLAAAIEMLTDARDRVKKLVDAGMTEEEVLAENPLANYHDTWNWGFITTGKMTSTLYRDLTTD